MTNQTELTEAEQTQRGQLLMDVLNLRPDKEWAQLHAGEEPRYRTAWGNKTALGIYLTAERIIKDGK